MLNLQLSNPNQKQWHTANGISVLGTPYCNLKGWLSPPQFIDYFVSITDLNSFAKALSELEGYFSVVINKTEFKAFAVDKIRSFPLLYCFKGTEWVVTDNINLPLIQNLPFNKSVEMEFIHFWCTMANNTLKENLYQLEAAQIAYISNDKLHTTFYYDPVIQNNQNEKAAHDEYPDLAFFDKWFELIKNQEVWVPLSGGYDSRAILVLLKLFGHQNINTFTYGDPKGFEAITAQKITTQLNINWHFVEYTSKTFDIVFSEKWAEYSNKSHFYSSLPHEQDFFAINSLKELDLISPGSFIIPGHYGDILNGSKHIKIGATQKDVYDKISTIYNLPTDKIKGYLQKYYLPSGNQYFLNWYLKNIASKYILNSVKIYEHFDCDWVVPFSDRGWMDHWLSTSEKSKVNSKFYHQFLNDKLFDKFNLSIEPSKPNLFSHIKPLIRPFILPSLMQKYKRNYFKKDINNINILYDLIYEELNDTTIDKDYVINRIFARYFLKQLGFFH